MQNVLERMEAIGAERKMADFNVKMKMDYEFKKNYAYIRAWEFMYPASACPIWRTGVYRKYIDSLGLNGFSR